MRKRSTMKFLAMLLLLAQLFSLTAGITVFAAGENETERDDSPVSLPAPYMKHNSTAIKAISMGGNNYAEGLEMDMGYNGGYWGSAAFNLDGKFSTVSFDAGFIRGHQRSAVLTVSGDGVDLLKETLIFDAIPKSYTLNVEGVKQLKFHYESNAYDKTYYGIGGLKGVLVGEPEDTVYVSDAFYDIPRYNFGNVAEVVTGEFEMGDRSYVDGYSFTMGYGWGKQDSASISFNFKKQYKEMTFDIARYAEKKDVTYTRSATLTIEADGVVIPEYDGVVMYWDDLVLPVKVDLTGVSQLKITVYSSGYDAVYWNMGNIQLKSDGKPHGILLDAKPVEGTDDYTATLTDKAPEIALNPRVYPSDAPREFNAYIESNGIAYLSEDHVVKAVHGGTTYVRYTLPDNEDVEVLCDITSKVTEHVWNQGEITKAPTLKEKGEKLYTCIVCEKTKKETLPKLTECEEHTWNEGEITKEPTYEAEGEALYTCTVCGKTEERTIPANNMCGENLYWSVKDGVLRIYTPEGDSMMYNYEKGKAPWYELRDGIHTIQMEKGLVIGENAFYDLYNVTRVELPFGLLYFQNAFEGCKSLSEFSFPDGSEGGYSIIHEGTAILRKVDYDDMDSLVLYACAPTVTKPVAVPDGVDTIHFGAFEGCGMTELFFPASLKLVLPGAFKNCPDLETVHYCGTEEDWAAVHVESDEPNGGNASLDAADLHFQIFVPEKAATCTEDGNDAHYSCADCDLYYDAEDPTVILAEAPVKAAEGHAWDDGVVTKEPTTEAEGEKLFTCENCGETKTEAIEKLIPENPFEDIEETDWFRDPVLWAYANGITGGIAANLFGPHESCTRGQVVTFLWAAAGKPAPTTDYNPFKDVAETDYFYKAVLWAVEKGITKGVAEDMFGPTQACTRGQIVTFLWASHNRPVPTLSENPFDDFDSSAYYYQPILWAVENEITTGIGAGKFGPESICTRCQIVTFLYKASMIEPEEPEAPEVPEEPEEPQLALVTDAYSKEIEGKYFNHCYHIPQINLPNDLAAGWNEAMYDTLYATIEKRVFKEMEKYDRPSLSKMIYAWGQKDDLVSIVLREDEYEYDWSTHTFYTVSCKTGMQVVDSEIYAAYGMTEEEFYAAVKIVLAAVMAEEAEYYKNMLSAEKIQQLIDKTLGDENIKAAKPFISPDGKLSFMGGVYTPAGAGRYYHLWTLEGENITIKCAEHQK